MGRAERILVFAVFGVIALILGITAFLPEGKDTKGEVKSEGTKGTIGQSGAGPTGGRGTGAQPGVLTPVDRMLQADQEPPQVGGKDAGKSAEVAKGSGEAVKGGETVTPPAPTAPIRFGVQHPSNPNYLMVKVRSGESFGQIVERECGSVQHYLEQAAALNESIDPNNIKAGQELILPFVPEDQLPRRAVRTDLPVAGGDKGAGDKNRSTPANATFGAISPGLEAQPTVVDKSRTAPTAKKSEPTDKGANKNGTDKNGNGASLAATASSTYKVQKGDTLWALAEKKWGKSKAKGKVQEILALNSGTLKSESDVLHPGVVLKLP